MSEKISLKEIDGMLENQQVDNQADSNVTEETPNETVTFSLADIDAMLDEGEKKPDFAAAKKASDALNGTGSVAKQPTAKTEQKVEQKNAEQQEQTQAQDKSGVIQAGESTTLYDPKAGMPVMAAQGKEGKRNPVIIVEHPNTYLESEIEGEEGKMVEINPRTGDMDENGNTIGGYTRTRYILPATEEVKSQSREGGLLIGTLPGTELKAIKVGWKFPGSNASKLANTQLYDNVGEFTDIFTQEAERLNGMDADQVVKEHNELAESLRAGSTYPSPGEYERLAAMGMYVHARDLGYNNLKEYLANPQDREYREAVYGSGEMRKIYENVEQNRGNGFDVGLFTNQARLNVQNSGMMADYDIAKAIGNLYTDDDKKMAYATALYKYRHNVVDNIDEEYRRLLGEPIKATFEEIEKEVNDTVGESTLLYSALKVADENQLSNIAHWVISKVIGADSDGMGYRDIMRTSLEKESYNYRGWYNSALGGITFVENALPAYGAGKAASLVMKMFGSGTASRIFASTLMGRMAQGAASGVINLPAYTYFNGILERFHDSHSSLGDVLGGFTDWNNIKAALGEAPTGAVLGPMALFFGRLGRAVGGGRKAVEKGASWFGEGLAFSGSSSIKKWMEINERQKKGEDVSFSVADVIGCTLESIGMMASMKLGNYAVGKVSGRENMLKNAKGERLETEDRTKSALQFESMGMNEIGEFLKNPRKYAKEHGITNETDMDQTALGKQYKEFLTQYQKGGVMGVDANAVGTAMWLIQGKAMMKPISYGSEIAEATGKDNKKEYVVYSLDELGNRIESRSFKNREKAEKWQEELRYDAEKYNMTKLEAIAEQRESEKITQKTFDTMFDEIANSIPSRLPNGEPDPKYVVPTRMDIANIIQNTMVAEMMLQNVRGIPIEEATKLREMVRHGRPFVDRYKQLMAENRAEAEARRNPENESMFREQAQKILEKKPNKRSKEENEFLQGYSDMLRASGEVKPYVGVATLNGQQVYVKNQPVSGGDVYYEAEDGSVQVQPAIMFTDFRPMDAYLDPRREFLEQQSNLNREELKEIGQQLEAEETAKRQNRQQEIEEKKKNAPVIDVQQPAQPEPKVDGSETSSPSTETLQAETPEPPKEEKSEASPEGKIEEPKTAAEHREVIDEEQKWLDEHQEAGTAQREQLESLALQNREAIEAANTTQQSVQTTQAARGPLYIHIPTKDLKEEPVGGKKEVSLRDKATAFVDAYYPHLKGEEREKMIDYIEAQNDFENTIRFDKEDGINLDKIAKYEQRISELESGIGKPAKEEKQTGSNEVDDVQQPEQPEPKVDGSETPSPSTETLQFKPGENGVADKPFHSYTLKSGKKVDWYVQTTEKDGVKVTRVVAAVGDKEVLVPAARFPFPKGYEIDKDYLPEGKVVGVKELRETADGAAATIIVEDEQGLTDYEVKLNKVEEQPKEMSAEEHRKVVDEEEKWLDEHQEADTAEREQHRQRKWASERALGLRDENNNEIVPPPIPGVVEQSPRTATANDGVEKGEPLNESETQSPTAQTEREPEEITPVTEETTGKADAGEKGRALTGEREGLMEITNEDLLNTTTLTEEDLADPEAGALKRAARRNAERQRDDAIAYSRGEIKDKPENFDYWKERLGLEEPKAENAMQPVEKSETMSPSTETAQGNGQGELAFGEETPEQREAREKQERVDKAASLRSRHAQLSEEIKQKQLEYRFMNDRKKQYQARQELNKLYDEIESVEQQLKETGEPMQVKRFNRPAKKERTQHAARKAYDEMRKKYKDDSEVMEILDDTEPQDIYEQIGIALGSSKLLFKSKGEGASRKRGVADETGWKWNDVKGMFQLFDNEKGQSVQNWAETFWADLDEGTKNRYSSTDIANMMLDVLGGASTIGDLRNIVLANRVRQAEELLEHREKEEEYWRDMERHEQEMKDTEEEAMLEHIKDLAENLDWNEINGILADEYAKEEKLKENGDERKRSDSNSSQSERSGVGDGERKGETGRNDNTNNREDKNYSSVERPTGEVRADSQEDARASRGLDSQRVSQERAGLSAKEREIVNRVNAGINEAIDDLDAEIRDLEKKGDDDAAEAARLERDMLENSREDMIDEALAGYEDLQGFKNGTRAEKQAAERVEKSLADRKAKRMRELLEKLRDPNTSDVRRRAVVRQLADLGVDASGFLEGREEIKEIEEVDDEVETPVEGVSVSKGRVELNAATLKDPVSREYLEQKMKDEDWSEEARKQFMQTLDDAADVVLEMGKRYKRLGDWNKMEILSETDEVDYNPRWRLMNRKGQWIPNRSAFKKNGEYPWNIDLGTLCTKRESFDALVQLIAEKGMAQNLGPTQIEAIKELLKDNDFLTACDICFNETKRARVISYANQISNNWRVVSEAIGVKDKMVGEPIALTQEQRNTLHRMAGRGYKSAFQELIPESERRQYKGEEKSGNEIDLGITASMMQRIAKQMLIDPTLVGKLKPETLITTEGMDWFLRTYGGHTDVNGILASAWGSGTPKPIEGFNLYDPLSWRDDYDQKKENPRWHEGLKSRPSIDWLMNNGGFRAQSFTDYHPMLFLDYLQMFTDVGVRKLPIHIYTKVPALVKLFGGSGAKINMSLVPKMEDGVDAEHAGLKPDGKGGWEYAWDNDSFPIEEAFSLRQDPRFRGNVGIIAVGLSDAHILKMLDDPTIDQVIPYHKSGMPESVQIKTGLKNATDYTDQQTTGGKPKKAADFNFNEAVRRTGDPRKAASEYVKWCEMNGYTPKFEQFKDHPNYYKVLADFRLFDNEGKYSEQEAVNPGKILGDNWKQELEDSLNDKTMQESVRARVAGNEKLMKDVERLMSKQRMDGAVRDEMVKKLKGALGKDNVESLKQNEFFNALEDAYKQTIGAEQAKAKVEVLRTTNGVVYGFASGGKITLNENVFNAETPIHEFTHIWVKVAQRENAKLWKKGKDLLKQTDEWQEVMNDDLYADIRGDEDAVASEVLARIVGSEGADYVRRLLDPEHKPLKQGGVYNQIKEWLREMFNNVRSLFAPSIRNLTYDEFVNMPLKTLFDEAEAKRFLEAKTRLESEGRLEGDVENEGVELQASSRATRYEEMARGYETVSRNTERRDREYAEAVEKGDTKKAEQMVKAAAKAAMPDTKVVGKDGEMIVMSHNTDGEFWEFDRNKIGTGQGQAFLGMGFNFSRGGNSTYGKNEMRVYLDAKNPLESDGHKLKRADVESVLRKLDEGESDTIVAEFAGTYAPYGSREYESALRKVAKDLVDGYDDLGIYGSISVVGGKANETIEAFKALGFDSSIERDSEGRIRNAVVFDSNQIKSADPVTYDDNGNVIPLSERFNTKKQDIRYRLGDGEKAQGGTFFSGGGLIESGLADVLDTRFGVEYDEKIAGVYKNNHGEHIVVADVRNVDPMEMAKKVDGPVQYFHASPVCKNFSKMKSGGETPLDIETAQSTADAIEKMRPRIVTIENVEGYANEDRKALSIITNKLKELGYNYDINLVNAADYGAATNRKRLIVRAVERSYELPPLPEGNKEPTPWYNRVEDLIPSLKESTIPEWMNERLQKAGIDWRNIDKPLFVNSSGNMAGSIAHAWGDEPAPTIAASRTGDKIIMPDGKVYAVNGRVLARLMGLPDSYQLPKGETLAKTVLGNGVPVELTKGVIEPLVREIADPVERARMEDIRYRLSDSRFSDDREFEQAVKEYNDTLRMNERRANRQGADYYPTPAPLALVASRLLHAEKGMDVLDIGSGSGMLHKYIKEGNVTAVEASPELAEANRKNTDANVVTGDFMEIEDGKKYDRIITNPPYGQKGAEAFRHATKGYESLADGGRMVAILPMGRNADRLYNEFVEKVKADGGRVTADVELPSCTFYKAGVHGSRTRMIVVDKNAEGETEKVNLGGITTNQGLYEAIYKMDVGLDGKVNGVDLSDASHRIGFSRPRGEGHMERVAEGVEKANRQLGGNAKVVREADLGKDVPKNAQAWYDPNTGEVHVVAERVNGAEDASRAVWHEEIGHKAMSELLGDRYNDWLDDVHKLLGSEHADAMKRLRETYAKELEGKSEEAQNRLLADEWIAELAERGEKDLSTWQKVKGMFRNWLWKHFGVMLGDGDIDYMLHKALAERRKGYRSKAMMSIAERRRAEEGNAMAEQSRRYRLLDEENRAEAKTRARDLLEAERDELNDKKTQMEDALNRALTVRRGDPSAENLAMSPKQRRELAASIERLEKRIDALNDSLAETDLTDPERVVNRAWDHVGLSTEAEMLMQKAESLMKTKDILRNAGVKSVENLTPEQRKEYDRYLWNGKIADARLTAMRDARPERPFEGSIDDNLGREPQYDDFRHPDLDRDDLSERDRSYLEGKANDDYARAKAAWNRQKEQLIEQLDDYEAECNDWRMRQRDYMREIVDAEKKLRADWQTDYWSAMENNQEADALLHVADMTGIPLTSKHDVQTYLRELRYEHVRRQQHAEGEDYKFIKEIESMVDKVVGTGSLANKVRKYGDRKQVMRDLIDMMEGTKEVTEEMKPIVKKIQQWFDDMFEWQVASGLVYAPWKYRQGYVPHLWNIDASRPDADAAAKIEKAGGLVPTRMNSPFMNERFYDTYEEGIQHGLVPKHESIIDLIKEYSKEVNKAVSNRQALDILRFVKAPIETEVWVEKEGGGKEKVKQTQWLPIVIDAGEVPPKGVQYNAYKNSAFYKDGTPQFLILSPRYVKGTERNIYSMFGEQGYVSSKDATDSYLEKALGAADKAGQTVKQTNLMFSAFHGIALTEHMLGSSRNPLRVIKQALYDTIIESVVTGKTLRMRKGDVAEDAMSHFVKLGNSYDFDKSMDVLTKLSDKINNPDNPEWRKFVNAKNDRERAKAAKALIRGTFGTPFKLLKLLKKGNDFILWDMLHDGYKLSVWDLRSRKLREKAKKKGWSEAELNRRLDDLGQTINDMFGGQHWELLNASPRAMRNLRLAFLSPDWNASWLRLWGRMAGMGKLRNDNFFRGLKNEEGKLQIPISGKAIKKAWKENNAQGLAFTVMLVSGIMAHIGYSLMNLAMRKKDIEEELAKAEEIRKTDPNYKSPYEEEGITPITWENFLGRANEWILSPWNSLSDPGRGTYVYVGRDANGVSRYIRPGKQMRELFELFLDSEDHLDLGAWYKAGMRKANPFAQLIHEAGTGYSLTGWENKELTQTYGGERELNRLKYIILHSVLPMSIVDPIEKGDAEKMGWRMAYPVSKGMTWYRGNKLLEEAIANDDSEMVERIRRSFVLNGMGEDFKQAYTSSLSKVRRKVAKAEDYENKTPDELFKMAAKSNDPKMRKKYVDKATEKLESTEEKEGKTAREAMEEYQQKAQKEGNYLLHCTAQDMEYDTHMKIFMKKAEEDGSVVATFRKMGGTIPKKTQVKKGKKVVDSRIEWKGKDGYTNADCEKFYKEHEDELIAYYRMNMFREGYNARIKEMKDLKGKEADAKMKEIREYRNKWMQYASEYLDTTTWKVKKHKK